MRYAVIGMDNYVENVIVADEGFSIPGKQLLEINDEKVAIGYFWDGDKFIEDSLEEAVKLDENQLMHQELGNILLESARDKARVVELESLTGGLLLEIAMVKGGLT